MGARASFTRGELACLVSSMRTILGVVSGEPGEPALVLSDERLDDFGGPAAVVQHFRAAPSPEACRNLLAVLLDHVAAVHIKVCPQNFEATGHVFIEQGRQVEAQGQVLMNVARLHEKEVAC